MHGDSGVIERCAAAIYIVDVQIDILRRGRIIIEGDGGRVAVVIAIQRDGHRVLALRVQRVTGGHKGVVRINLRRIRGNGDGFLIEEVAACIVIGHGDTGREDLRRGRVVIEGDGGGLAAVVAIERNGHGALALRAQGVPGGHE